MIGVIKIDTKDLSKSEVVLQAKMHTTAFTHIYNTIKTMNLPCHIPFRVSI